MCCYGFFQGRKSLYNIAVYVIIIHLSTQTVHKHAFDAIERQCNFAQNVVHMMKKHAKLMVFFLSRTLLLKESPLPVSLSFCNSNPTMSRIKLIVYYFAEAVQYGDIVMSHSIVRQINRHFFV